MVLYCSTTEDTINESIDDPHPTATQQPDSKIEPKPRYIPVPYLRTFSIKLIRITTIPFLLFFST